MTHPVAKRPRLTAAALVAAPALVAAGDLLAGADPDAARAVLAEVAAHPDRYFVSRALFYAGMLLLLPGVIALMRLTPQRGRRWTTIGAVMTGIGAACYGGGEFMLGTALPFVTDAAVPRESAVHAYDHVQGELLLNASFLLGLFAYIGLIVIGIGVLRAGTVARPLAIALVAAPVLWFVGAVGSYTVGALASVPLLVTYALVVSPVLRSDRSVALREDASGLVRV